MNRSTSLLWGGMVVAFAGWAYLADVAAENDVPVVLHRAWVEIDASRFPTLQAALDALPAKGGLVRLPAGEFEITEPLRLHRGDVCLTGAGTATHIRLTNALAAVSSGPKFY